jgi:hypothetical protein
MLAILVTWIISLSLLFAIGHLFIRVLNLHEKNAYNFADVVFFGFCFTGTILAILSVWIPLTSYVLLFLFLFSISYLIYSYRKKQLSLLTDTWLKIKSLSIYCKLLLAFVVFVVAFYALLPPLNVDSALYHWQTMMWMESYPAVPGLANLHGRLGFNSNGLLLHSVFSLHDIFGSYIIGLNGLLLIILFGWIIFKIRELKLIPQLAVIGFACVFLRYYDVDIASPVTDLIPNIIIPYLLLRAILDYHSLTDSPLLYWVLPIFCLTLKLSVAPFCLFSLIVFVCLIKNKQYKSLSILIILGCILLIPWLVRNVIISGYLIYPNSTIDLFNFDWKVPVGMAEREQISIRAWARLLEPDFDSTMNLPLLIWGKSWLLRNYELSKIVILVLGLVVLSPLVILFTQRKKLIKDPYRIYPWLIAVLGTLFWAVMAPDIRFGFGYIAFTAFAPFMLINSEIKNSFLKKTPLFVGFLALLFFTGVCFNVIRITQGDKTYSSFLYKPNTMDFVVKRASVEFIPFKANDITIYVPATGDQCFDHQLPCAPNYVCLDCLEMRGTSVKEGFRTKVKE